MFRLNAWALATLALLVGLNGCAGGLAPADWSHNPRATALLSGQSRDEALKALYPPLDFIHALGHVRLNGSKVEGRTRVHFTLHAVSAQRWRWFAWIPHRPNVLRVIDAMQRGDLLEILQYRLLRLFRGRVNGDNATPIETAWGWTPADWYAALDIGPALAAGDWTETKTGDATAQTADNDIVLVPADGPADGLERIVLDRLTGLPRRGEWRRGDRRWTVRYESWDWFDTTVPPDPFITPPTDSEKPEPRLMPRRLRLEYPAGGVGVEVNIDQYQWKPEPDDKVFTWMLRWKPSVLPLDSAATDLEKP